MTTQAQKIVNIERDILNLNDQIKVLTNKLDAMSKLYAEALSNLKIQEQKLRDKKQDESRTEEKVSVSKKKARNKRKKVLST